jgi:hypothetical protein
MLPTVAPGGGGGLSGCDVLDCGGCADGVGRGSDNVRVFIMFTTLASPIQPITLVIDALGIET